MKSESPPVQPGRGPLRRPGVGRHEHPDAVTDDPFELDLMPAAGIGHDDLGIAKAQPAQLAPGRADHRLEVSEVGRLGLDLGGDDDLSSDLGAELAR